MKKFAEQQNLLERIDLLIRLQSTGTGEEFAGKLGISRATLFRKMEYLREKGASIEYCRCRRTYYYDE